MYTLLNLEQNHPPFLAHSLVVSNCATSSVVAGITQEAASRTIGHELSLIGVPAPTTLDGYRPASPDEVKTFMISVGLSNERSADVAQALKDDLNITSTVQFQGTLPQGVVPLSPGLENRRALVHRLEMGSLNVLCHTLYQY